MHPFLHGHMRYVLQVHHGSRCDHLSPSRTVLFFFCLCCFFVVCLLRQTSHSADSTTPMHTSVSKARCAMSVRSKYRREHACFADNAGFLCSLLLIHRLPVRYTNVQSDSPHAQQPAAARHSVRKRETDQTLVPQYIKCGVRSREQGAADRVYPGPFISLTTYLGVIIPTCWSSVR